MPDPNGRTRVRIGILGDTHMPRGRRAIDPSCLSDLARCELIIHTGDFTAASVLTDLEALGPPVCAVHGNVDQPELRRRLRERTVAELAGVSIGLIHDAGPARGRLERMRHEFPGAAAVVFGHSHLPLHERSEGFQIFNPGSPTERRRAPKRSYAIAEVSAGEIAFRHVWLS